MTAPGRSSGRSVRDFWISCYKDTPLRFLRRGVRSFRKRVGAPLAVALDLQRRTRATARVAPTRYEKRATCISRSGLLVPLTGLEPVRSCPQRILSPRCLPFHHSGITTEIFYHSLIKPSRRARACPRRPAHVIALGGIYGAGGGRHTWAIIQPGRRGHDPALQKPGLPLGRPGGDQNSSAHLFSADAMTASMS